MENHAFRFTGEAAVNYDRYLGPFLFEPYAIEMSHRLENCAGSVLEIACGTGRVTRQLCQRLSPQVQLIATDLSADMLAVAQKELADQPIEFQVADAQNLPFRDNSFDVVVCQFGLMFLPDPNQGFREAFRVLKPGGKFYFSTWDRSAKVPIFKIIFNENILPLFPPEEEARLTRPFSMYDPKMLLTLAQSAKFKNIVVEEVRLKSVAENALQLVNGFLIKHSLGNEILTKDPNALVPLAKKMEAQIATQFGTPVVCELNAFLGVGEK